MAAQSGKLFQDILCESRAHPVETTDPVAAKTIDDLKKQVSRQRTEIETERAKLRELQRSHERELVSIHDQSEKKLNRSLEALSHRKDDEKVAEISQVKERLLKQNQQELRTLRGDLEDEMKRLERRLTREREESMRKILNLERKKTEEELSHYLPEDTVMTREEHLKAEIFRLGEEVERLEFQVSNLQRENKEQINTIKKEKHEHKLEVESLLKKNQAEAARDLAQLKLAEQIIQEKERHIQDEEYRVDLVLMEKEALTEELASVRSQKTLDALSRDEAVVSPALGKRVSMPGGSVLQRRVEELEGTVIKLDEERRQLKQENASLRKAAVKEGGEGDGKGAEEKLKRLRKRNAELVALTRQLDDRTKTLKMENEQLKLSASSGGVVSSVGGGSVGGGEKGKGGVGDGDARRSLSLSRQHAKDISEYTKQILAKDRELDSLRKKLAKYEVDGKARYEPAPDMEKRMRSMAMERLKMEKVMVQLYSKVSDPLDVGVVTKREMENESKEMERLFDDNKTLRDELELLKSQARMEEVDHSAVPESLPTLIADKTEGGGGSKREQELTVENAQLQARVSALVKCEADVCTLEVALKEVETAKTSYEQQNRRLTQQLRDAQLLALEMDAVQEKCAELEKEVVEVKGQLSDRNTKLEQMEMNYKISTESLSDAKQETDSLRVKVAELEDTLKEKQLQIRQLATELDEQQDSHRQPSPLPPPACDVALQTSFTPSPDKLTTGNPPPLSQPGTQAPPSSHAHAPSSSTNTSNRRVKHSDHPSSTGERRVKSASKSRRIKSPTKRASAVGSGGVAGADVSLDNEMRLAGYDITDPYDSSEGVAFSDTNLDGSGVLSFDEEGMRGGGESGMLTRSPATTMSDIGRVELEGERQAERTATEGLNSELMGAFTDDTDSRTVEHNGSVLAGSSMADKGVESTEIMPKSVVTSSPQSHDVAREMSVSMTTAQNELVQGEGEGEREGEEEGKSGGEKLFADVLVLGGEGEKEGREREEERGVSEEGGVKVIDLEALAEEDSSGENVSSSGSEIDLQARKNREMVDPSQELVPLTSDPVTSTTAASTVSVFIAKYSYNPAEMSPNPSYDQELSIAAGDYLYVFGAMDEDGFYHAQLVTGETGLVPSNFVEKVAEGEGDPSLPRPSHFGVHSRRVSDLQDIPEVDEDVSTSSSACNNGIPPPCDLELERQFVEEDKYSVVIQWTTPASLPPSSQVTYHVYVNHQYKETVAGTTSGIMSAHLSDIPRQQLMKISVRTVTEEGESPDPKKLIILNPQYPEPPTRVQVSSLEEPPSSHAILVQWTPTTPVEMGTRISGYIILLNDRPFMQLQSNSIPTDAVYAKLLPSDLKSLTLMPEEKVVLTVRAVSEHYQSLDSDPILVAKELLDAITSACSSGEGTTLESVGGREAFESSHSSVVSSEPEGRGRHSPAEQIGTSLDNSNPEHYVTQAGGYVTQNNNHVASERGSMNEPDGQVTNGKKEHVNSLESVNGVGYGVSESREEVDGEREPIRGGPRYYTAMFAYNPLFHSPNEEAAEEELAFRDGDIITALSEVDEEGFFEGMLRGKRGLVPSNMVELVTDPDGLEQIPQLLADQQCRSPDPLSRLPTLNGGEPSNASRRMRAIYGYNPATDSPNENKEDELCIQEGDIVTVFSKPDEDGYYQGELKGKRGLVPSNFLEEVMEERMEGEGSKKGIMGSTGMEIFAASEQDLQEAERVIAEASDSLKRSNSHSTSDSTKHKKGILSKGKSLFSKGVGKK